MRISVSSWATTEADVERSLAAIVRGGGGGVYARPPAETRDVARSRFYGVT